MNADGGTFRKCDRNSERSRQPVSIQTGGLFLFAGTERRDKLLTGVRLMAGSGIICPMCNGNMDSVSSTIRAPGAVIRYRKCRCGHSMPTIEIQKSELLKLEETCRNAGFDPRLIEAVCHTQTPAKRNTVTRKTNLYDFVSAVSSHSRRAGAYGVIDTLTLEEWGEVLIQTDWKCAMCGSDREIEIEHMIPLSRGGGNTKENVCVLCADCNGRKGAKMPLEWVFSR